MLRVHPMHIVDSETIALLEAWRALAGGMGGPGPLPQAGGSADQSCLVIDAFKIFSETERKLEPPRRRDD